jgi:hypothetical protein
MVVPPPLVPADYAQWVIGLPPFLRKIVLEDLKDRQQGFIFSKRAKHPAIAAQHPSTTSTRNE